MFMQLNQRIWEQNITIHIITTSPDSTTSYKSPVFATNEMQQEIVGTFVGLETMVTFQPSSSYA